MTETSTERPGRAWIKYDPEEDTGEIALPGHLDAVPSIVRPGDAFSVPAEHVDELTAEANGGRFKPTDAPAQESPNEALTRAELAEKLGDPSLATEPKPDLVELADEHDRTNPQPVGADESAGAFVPPFDAAVAEQQNADENVGDTESGDAAGEGEIA